MTLIQFLLIAALGSVFSAWLIPLILLRNVQSSVANVITTSTIGPLVAQGQRATYLSLQSLTGRLSFSAALVVLSTLAGGTSATDASSVQTMLQASAVFTFAGLLVVWLTRRNGDTSKEQNPTSPSR